MRHLLRILGLAALFAATVASAQQHQYSLAFPPTTIVSPTDNQCLVYQASSKRWVNGSCSSGGGATVTGSPANGNLAFFSGAGTISNGNLSGDCSTAGTGVLTCTKTGGVAFAAVATSGSATDLGSGTLSASLLPPLIPSAATFSASGCSNSTLVGGANTAALIAAGSFNAGVNGTCTIVLTLPAATHGWSCGASDTTLQLNFVVSAKTTTSCTMTSSTNSGDVVTFWGFGY